MKAKESDLKLAKQIKVDLQKKLGDQLLAVYLYGSRARGTAHPESDMDLFLLMKRKPTFMGKEENAISDIAMKYLNNRNVYVSPTTYSYNQYKKWRNYTPVLYWIDKEGIKL